MLPGYQKRLWHEVPSTNSSNKRGDHLRFAISLNRKLLSVGSDSASLSVKGGVVGGLLEGEIVTSTSIVNKTNPSHVPSSEPLQLKEPSSKPLQLKVLKNGFLVILTV